MSNFGLAIKSGASVVARKVSEHSPEIFMGIGIVGSLMATGLACKATLKAPSIIEENRKNLNDIRLVHATTDKEKYSENDYRKDLAITYTKTAMDIVKLYGPSLVLEVVSLGCLFESNHILRQRNAALTATCASISALYNKYRKNVIEKYGEEVDADMRLGRKTEKVDVVQEDGTVKKEKVTTVDTAGNDYLVIFGPEETNEATKNRDYNESYLINLQNTMTDLLRSRYKSAKHPGYLYWEEVLPALGFDPREERRTYTKDGQKRKSRASHHVGWIYDPDNQDLYGDGYVDFRLKSAYNKRANAGYEPTFILDPNIDGFIDDYVAYGVDAFGPTED